MYKNFYGFQKQPFSVTPDTEFFFPSAEHTEALSSMTYAVKEKRGFVVITGEIGTGKTTVCNLLLNKLDSNAKTAVITNTLLTRKQMLESICNEFNLKKRPKMTKLGLLNLLHEFLIQQYKENNNVVLIIDEAQNLTHSTLEEIRLLSNLETEKDKLLQIILVGQPELKEKLESPKLRQFKQRIWVSYHIPPLTMKEAFDYINHRLKIAGPNGKAKFTYGALQQIYEHSNGIPRLINITCDQLLLLGYTREATIIDIPLVWEIIKSEKKITENEFAEKAGLLDWMKLHLKILSRGR